MNVSELELTYLNQIKEEQKKLPPLKKQIFTISVFRLLTALIGIGLCYITWGNTLLVIGTALFFFILFILLLKHHGKLTSQRDYQYALIKILENEIKSLNYDFSAFDGASEKIQPDHSFSYDLDLFGDRSFFQSINRSITSFGKDFLANLFLSPFKDAEKTLSQQEAIKELTAKQKLITHFRVMGKITEKEDIGIQKFADSFSNTNLLYKNKFWEVMTYLVPASYLLLLILYLLNIVPGTYFIFLWLITFALGSYSLKYINKILGLFDKKTDILSTYSLLFKIIEEEKFDSVLLKTNQSLLTQTHASEIIKKLGRYCSNLNMGLSYPVVLFFNPVLFWNVRYSILVEKWLAKYQKEIPNWFEALARFETLSSLSVFAYNHPDYTYPKVFTDHFIFEGKELGHPLIPKDICITNDISIDKESYFLVVTGANMAGKSTYLRTVGLNHLLACIGAPVFAKSLSFHPGSLVTNLRTTDSLADQESYFFSELKRLKMIIDRLQSGEHLFIILDEILKGTNSEDKQKGSLALMKQLISLNGNGIIATHDLVLGGLEKEYPSNIKNYCFEADITNDKLTFTYKIREGIAQNMNATFLMKKMGITGL